MFQAGGPTRFLLTSFWIRASLLISKARVLDRFPKAESSEFWGEAGLSIRGVRKGKSQDLLDCASNHAVELDRMLAPLMKRSCSHEVDSANHTKTDPKQVSGRL